MLPQPGKKNPKDISTSILSHGLSLLMGNDIEHQATYFKLKQHFNKLVGVYESYKGVLKQKVVVEGGMLHIEPMNPHPMLLPKVPLFPLNGVDLITLQYYFPTVTGGRILVEFGIDENNQIWLNLERWKSRKI